MDNFEDKDVYFDKLPNKLKEFLRDPLTFSLGSEEDIIGSLKKEFKYEN